MDGAGIRGHHHPPALDVAHIVTQGLRNGIERQRPVNESADEIQAAHLLLPFGTDGPIALAHRRTFVHRATSVSRFSDIIILVRRMKWGAAGHDSLSGKPGPGSTS